MQEEHNMMTMQKKQQCKTQKQYKTITFAAAGTMKWTEWTKATRQVQGVEQRRWGSEYEEDKSQTEEGGREEEEEAQVAVQGIWRPALII